MSKCIPIKEKHLSMCLIPKVPGSNAFCSRAVLTVIIQRGCFPEQGCFFWMKATAHFRNMWLSYWNKWCTFMLPYLGEETTLQQGRLPTDSLQQQLWQSTATESKIWLIFLVISSLNCMISRCGGKSHCFLALWPLWISWFLEEVQFYEIVLVIVNLTLI